MLSQLDMLTHDYDWFCVINGYPVCVSSAGDYIPSLVNYDDNIIRSIKIVKKISPKYDASINRSYLQDNIINKGYDYLNDPNYQFPEDCIPQYDEKYQDMALSLKLYCEHFIEMAKKGFYTFDRDIYSEHSYHLVAWPDVDTRFSDLCNVVCKESIKIDKLDFSIPTSLVELNLVELIDNCNQ